MKVKEESEKVGLKWSIQKTKIMASRPITSWQIDGETMVTVRDFIFGGSKITADSDCSHELKRRLLSSLQSLSCVQLFATPWTAARQASLSITSSQSPPKLMSIELVMPSNHLILCRPLLLLPSIFPSIRVFSNESALRIRWPKYWSFSFNISPSSNTQDLSPLGWTGWIPVQSNGLSRVFSNTTVQKHQFFGAQLSSQSNSHIHPWLLEKP